MFAVSPVEAIARALVAGLLPALEAAMIGRGLTYRAATAEAVAALFQAWAAAHGADVAQRAAAILEQLGPAAVLTPYGRASFLATTPLAAIPSARAIVGNAPPPREAIGGLRRAWAAVRWWLSADP